jgi:hypothetical protein
LQKEILLCSSTHPSFLSLPLLPIQFIPVVSLQESHVKLLEIPHTIRNTHTISQIWYARSVCALVVRLMLCWNCYLTHILPGKLTENTFSFTAMTWGIVKGSGGGMNEPIVSWG